MNKSWAVAPILFNLNPAFKINLTTEKLFHINTCSWRNSLKHCTVFANNYTFIPNTAFEIVQKFIKLFICCYFINLPTIKLDFLFNIIQKSIYNIFFVFSKYNLSIKILDFAPWNLENEQSIIKDFFNLLNNEISLNKKPKKDTISKIFESYVSKITGLKKENNKVDTLSLKKDLEKNGTVIRW